MNVLKSLLLVIGILCCCVLPSHAGEFTILDSSRYGRGVGTPVTENGSFNSPVAGSNFTLTITNGDTQGNYRVSSATILINGIQVAGPDDFNQDVGVVVKKVSLGVSNSYSVSIASAPGTFLTMTITGEDTTTPLVTIASPVNGYSTDAGNAAVYGTVSDDTPCKVVLNGVTSTVNGGNFTANGVPLVPGQNTITATATDLGGNTATCSITVIRQIYPPAVVGMSLANAQSVIAAANLTTGNITYASSDTVPAGSVISQNPLTSSLVLPGASVDLVVSNGAASVSVPNVVGMSQSNAEAAITAANLVVGGITKSYSSSVPAGTVASQTPAANTLVTTGAAVALVVSEGPAPSTVPPDPSTIAPPVDATVATTVAASTAFLYSGDNPIQTGVAAGTIEMRRAAVLRGKVTARDGNPISGVTVTVLNHPEFGQTITRDDGMFDMAVNGGGLLTVNYAKDGLLSSQRQVNVPWNDFAWLPDVVMIPVDMSVTSINLTSANQYQAHRGNLVTDKDGSRQATLLFSPGTTAQMILPDGTTQSLGNMNVRATEYTVGPAGPKTMPGLLPPASGYTYAAEFSADEAIAAGAKQVTFNQPVHFYVDNFLGFPVGETVPTGYYDREAGQWIASRNGRVISILSINGGLADIDTNGDGLADDATSLAALNITQEEQQQLAALYTQTPKQLWRVPISHFTPWDCNWPVDPPLDAIAPSQPISVNRYEDDPNCTGGSIIECQNQVLGESIDVPGTSFTLNYRSSRVPLNISAYTLNVPISGSSLPASLKRIELLIDVAGQHFSQSFPATANQNYSYVWDGKDAYGRRVQGRQPLTVSIGYVYDAVYLLPSESENSFGRFSDSGASVVQAKDEIELTILRKEKLSIGGFSFDATSHALGGWDMNIHHVYDPIGKILLLGDGSQRSAQLLASTIMNTVAGNGMEGYRGDAGPATNAAFQNPYGVATAPDGSIYIADTWNNRIRKVGTDGMISTVAGNGYQHYGGDGGPATSASLAYPYGVAIGPDGSIYIADSGNYRIRRVGSDGIITTLVGNGNQGSYGDGGLAASASLNFPTGVAVGPDGNLYIAEPLNGRIRQVGSDGIITTVAGNGSASYAGDGGPATSASLNAPFGVAVGADGSIYIADTQNHRIRQIGNDGIINTIAGNGNKGYGGDGGLATTASLNRPHGIAVGPDGTVYIADSQNQRIRKVGTHGTITTAAGNGNSGYGGDGGPANNALLSWPVGVSFGPDGNIYVVDNANQRIRMLASSLPGVSTSEIAIPSEGGELVYIFNSGGRHLRTINAFTGATLFGFGYDSGGKLISVTDGNNKITTIERDFNGNPTAIVAPFGRRTELNIDSNGYLSSVTNSAGETTRMSYNDGGLMTTFTDPKGNIHSFIYDSKGLLVRDANPAGGYKALDGTDSSSNKQVVLNTALGRATTYLTEFLSNGDQRKTITNPTGAKSLTLTKTDGSEQYTMPNGMIGATTLGVDPRFGVLVQMPGSTLIKTPSGLTLSTVLTRTITLENPSNPLSIVSQTDSLNINNRIYTTVYNASSKSFTQTSPAGRSSSTTIDTLGRPVSLLPSTGLMPVSFTYDAQGFLASASQGSLTTTYGYDTLKRLINVTNANGQSTGFAYDSADRVNRLTLPSGRSYQFTYDPNGNRTQITMPNGSVHKLGYTVIDLGSDYTPPNNPAYSFSYNLDKDWTRTTLPGGRTVDAAYDSGGRITGIVYPEASTGYVYGDSTDRIASLVRTAAGGGSQQINYSYDGSLVTQRTFTGVSNGRFTYAYDNNFFLRQISLASVANATVIPITRDADGLITGYGPFSFTRSGPAGAVSQISDSALSENVTYDSLGRVASRTHTVNGQSVYSIQLTYDNIGNISRKVETVAGVQTTWDYAYDADGQLTGVKNNGVDKEQFGYDVNGNRTIYNRPGDWTASAEFDTQDRITRQGGVTYQFNADGQLTQRGQDTFQYSATGELLSATISGQNVTYTYDGMGRRAARTDSSGTFQYLYGNQDNPFQLTASRDPQGILSYYYYDDSGLLYALDKGSIRYYVATDQVGTPKVVTDATGAVVKQMEFDGFGMWTFDSNPGFDLPVGFAGGIVDTGTTLVRFGYRDYEPGTGRWAAKDPIFFDGGMNLFGYVQNNPVNLIDPNGKSWIMPAAIVAGASIVGGFWLYEHNERFRGVVDSVLGNTVPDSGVNAIGTVLLNPESQKAVIGKLVERFNTSEELKALDDPSYQPRHIDEQLVQTNPLKAYKLYTKYTKGGRCKGYY